VGRPFARIVISAYHEDRITGNDLAEYLGGKLKWLPEIESVLAGRNAAGGGE
jgi:hypothetical protein